MGVVAKHKFAAVSMTNYRVFFRDICQLVVMMMSFLVFIILLEFAMGKLAQSHY